MSSPSRCSPTTPPPPSKPDDRYSSAAPAQRTTLVRSPGRITNYTAHRLHQHAPSWTRRIKPLNAAWMPAESYRRIREPMKQLISPEKPPELAAMNVFIRERSLATA